MLATTVLKGPILGVIDGSLAQPGMVGEFLQGIASIPVVVDPAVHTYNVIPMALPPGDWDIEASFYGPGLSAEALALHLQPAPPGVVLPMEGNLAVINPGGYSELHAQINTNRTQASVGVPTQLPFLVTVRAATTTSLATVNVTARRMR
jgi:hypothetical protein